MLFDFNACDRPQASIFVREVGEHPWQFGIPPCEPLAGIGHAEEESENRNETSQFSLMDRAKGHPSNRFSKVPTVNSRFHGVRLTLAETHLYNRTWQIQSGATRRRFD